CANVTGTMASAPIRASAQVRRRDRELLMVDASTFLPYDFESRGDCTLRFQIRSSRPQIHRLVLSRRIDWSIDRLLCCGNLSKKSGRQCCEIMPPMKATTAIICQFVFALSVSLAPLVAQTPGGQQQQPEFIRQGQQLMREGKFDEALALYRQTLQTSPDSAPANIAAGSVLDLMGQSKEGRKYFEKAIEVADTPERKAMAQRALAISYAFSGDCKKTVQYEQQVFDYYGSVKNFYQQGEIADEAARVCIDLGDLNAASHWYQVGHDTGLQEPDIKPARVDLWEFRWEHAQARIAA